MDEREQKDKLKKEILAQLSSLPERRQRELWGELKEKGLIG